MKKSRFILIVALVVAFTFFASCDLLGGLFGGGSAATDEFQGIWVAVGEDGGLGKAMLLEFSGNKFTRIAYTEIPDQRMDQEEGSKGSFTISGDTLKLRITEAWNANAWRPASGSKSLPFIFEDNNNKLVLHIDNDRDAVFLKKSFSQPEPLVKTWYGEGTMNLESDGSYSFTKPGISHSGDWAATSDMFRLITTSYNGEPGYLESLYKYEITGNNLSLSWK